MRLDQLKGVGPKRLQLLHLLNIYSLEDLIKKQPRRFEDRSNIIEVEKLRDQEKQLVSVELKALDRLVYLKGKRTLQKAYFFDETGPLQVLWYNQRYIRKKLQPGQRYYLYGQYQEQDKNMINPLILEKVEDLGIYPIYDLTQGLHNNFRIDITKQALDQVDFQSLEILKEDQIKELGFKNLQASFYQLHFPDDQKSYLRASYEISFRQKIVDSFLKEKVQTFRSSYTSPTLRKVNMDALYDQIPFELTEGQKDAVDDIESDLIKKEPMNRLIQGDVGSGKTILAFIAAYITIKNSYQVAMMAPTEILARQHFNKARPLFSRLGINIYLSTGSDTLKERKTFSNACENENGLFIGTHTLFQDQVVFKNLALVITDEQQRFGVQQRSQLQEKASIANTLVLSATPIPRTLALVEVGDLDLTIIKDLPPGRKPIATYVVNQAYEKRIYDFINKHVKNKEQAYVVCPRIESSEEDLSYWSIEEVYTRMHAYLADLRIGILHGSLSAEKKTEILASFSQGEIDILISTTVIEVGIDVEMASIMLVCAANYFGLSQLHQLRGRIGRGSLQSHCILLAQSPSKAAWKRLKVLEQTNNGFEIARKDLELRGSGDRFGLAQHGIIEKGFFGHFEEEWVKGKVSQYLKKHGYALQDFEPRLMKTVERDFNRIKNIGLN